jgi:hypothetical protein
MMEKKMMVFRNVFMIILAMMPLVDAVRLTAQAQPQQRPLHQVLELLCSNGPGSHQVLEQLELNGYVSAKGAHPRLRGDRNYMLRAVAQKGSDLQFASEGLRSDRHVVWAAVRDDWRALQFASEGLRTDRAFVPFPNQV